MPTPYDRALDELGKTRSELATYMRHNVKQQKRIRELEERLSLLADFLEGVADASPEAAKDVLTAMVNQIRTLLNKKG